MNLKSSSLENYYEVLELLFNTMPYVFWKDRQGKYQGSNLNQALNLGFSSPVEFIGKTIFEILADQKSAQLIEDIDSRIMREGKTVISEEKLITPKGVQFFLTQKSPIHNDKGEVIGLLGFAMDITEIKRQEELIKNERDRLVNVAAQVAHDIRSPAASVLMLAKACHDIPEKERISLREAAMNIQDIANNLLNQYKKKETKIPQDKAAREYLLVSAFVLQLLAEKKLQYQDLPIKITHEFSPKGYFAFIKMDASAFKRALSNIINNAVDAFDGDAGEVIVKIAAETDWVTVAIEDNGKGMPPELVEKILDNEIVTKGKQEGHGIGLSQVRETLQHNQGTLAVISKVGEGSKIILTFPRLAAPNWIAEEISLKENDFIIILDDDASIHGAWNARFEAILKANPLLQLKHFMIGEQVVGFINSLTPLDKERIFLLTDYELLKQKLNGLQVIVDTQVRRSILVTSHYANLDVLEQAEKLGTKILPKQLAPEIPVIIRKDVNDETDLIIVDDDEQYVQNLVFFAFADKNVEQYHDPRQFLEEVSHYSKDTKICLDNNYKASPLTGIQIARQLHDRGYTQLYLISGDIFAKDELPNYLTVIRKDDLEAIQNMI